MHEIASAWLADSESGIVGVDDSREDWLGIRFRQENRDFTTLWVTAGELTVSYEAYLSPPPPDNADRVFELCLKRNNAAWLAHIAIDRHGDLVVRGQFPVADLSEAKLDEVVGAVHGLVDATFPHVIRLGFAKASTKAP